MGFGKLRGEKVGGVMLFGCGGGMFHRHHACAGWLAVGICIMVESGGVIWNFFGWGSFASFLELV